MHPSLIELKDFKTSGEPPMIADHVSSCERCQTILDGIENLESLASQSGVANEQLTEQSKERVRERIKKQSSKRKRTFLRYAASILLLAVAGWFFLNPDEEKGSFSDQAISSIYKAPPLLRSNEEGTWNKFISLYEEKAFEEGFKLLNDIGVSGQSVFYQGLCKIYQPEPDLNQAIIFLNDPLVQKSRYAQQANYIAAVCYLQLGDQSTAKKILKTIRTIPSHYKFEEAAILLEDIRE